MKKPRATDGSPLLGGKENWRLKCGSNVVRLHLLLDHEGYLPVFASITTGKIHDVKIAQAFPSGTRFSFSISRGKNGTGLGTFDGAGGAGGAGEET